MPTIAIFTDGEKTETNYFLGLCKELRLVAVRLKSDYVHLEGTGFDPVTLVTHAVERAGDYDETWVVFDRDDHTNKFDNAIALANTHGVKVAYSNECFELWLILHFERLETDIGRNQYFQKLGTLLGRKYRKNDIEIFNMVKSREGVAIRTSKSLEKMHDDNGVIPSHKRAPSTTVFRLVERLRELRK
ncbi:MAG: RloB domain-containing protein [Candidatus Pacebacteria bacterium]|nr:RloB domain-containing protein [Candidatus Paceibacterota bacterium]